VDLKHCAPVGRCAEEAREHRVLHHRLSQGQVGSDDALGDSLDRVDNNTFSTFVDTVRDWLSARIVREGPDTARLAQLAEVWEKLNRTAREVEVFNLERKPMIFAVFGSLAETARR
jgi:hypothetical protein